MALEKNTLGSIATLMSTELNSLASGSAAVAASAFNNTIGSAGDGYTRGLLELVASFGSAPAASSGVTVWFLSAPDGTNYEDGGASVTPARSGVTFVLRAVAGAQRIVLSVAVPPGPFKALLLNNATGQALASSGNTLKFLPFTPGGY